MTMKVTSIVHPITDDALFSGSATVELTPDGARVLIPAHVVVPPGYALETVAVLDPRSEPIGMYRVTASRGLRARYLRWRYPWHPPAGKDEGGPR